MLHRKHVTRSPMLTRERKAQLVLKILIKGQFHSLEEILVTHQKMENPPEIQKLDHQQVYDVLHPTWKEALQAAKDDMREKGKLEQGMDLPQVELAPVDIFVDAKMAQFYTIDVVQTYVTGRS